MEAIKELQGVEHALKRFSQTFGVECRQIYENAEDVFLAFGTKEDAQHATDIMCAGIVCRRLETGSAYLVQVSKRFIAWELAMNSLVKIVNRMFEARTVVLEIKHDESVVH